MVKTKLGSPQLYANVISIKQSTAILKLGKRKDKFMLEKNFILIVIGQIISLFGNAILRFALPLYLLNETNSAMLFGLVSACSFIPMILLSPIGGMIADRINKRNIMVALDFLTTIITLLFTLYFSQINLTVIILVMLTLLYGIQAAYQPAVQASIPLLMSKENLIKGNAIINLVSSLASLSGPIAGGAVFGFFGIYPILYISIPCFVFSAIMELFIKIPYKQHTASTSIIATFKMDLKESLDFIRNERPVIWKLSIAAASVNLFFSSLIIIALPVIITQTLGFPVITGNQLYGYAQGALAAGSLLGGLLAGILSKIILPRHQYLLLILSSLSLLPIAAVLLFAPPAMVIYYVIITCCFFMITLSSLFSIVMISYLQMLTPEHMLGKVTSCVMCICMCSQPIGQAVYGLLIEQFKNQMAFIFIAAFIITTLITSTCKKIFNEIYQTLHETNNNNIP